MIRSNLTVYLCDPRKADGCSRRNCWAHKIPGQRGTCRYTTNPKHAVINDVGQPVRALPGELKLGDRIKHDPLALVDESKLSKEDRLGLAYCRLNFFQWDELFGPKPDGFEDLPNYNGPGKTKHDYIAPIMRSIDLNYSDMLMSRAWWLFGLGRTEEEWRLWYFYERLKRTDQSDQRDDRWNHKCDNGPSLSKLRRFLSFFKPS